MILRTDCVQESGKRYIHSPSDVFPVPAHGAELSWLRALPAIGLGDSKCDDSSIHKGKNRVPWRDLSHGFIKWIASAVGITLRRPKITARDLLAECLILVYHQ